MYTLFLGIPLLATPAGAPATCGITGKDTTGVEPPLCLANKTWILPSASEILNDLWLGN